MNGNEWWKFNDRKNQMAWSTKYLWILFALTDDKEISAWEDNTEIIGQEVEAQYELLDVEDEKFYRGNLIITNNKRFHQITWISSINWNNSNCDSFVF